MSSVVWPSSRPASASLLVTPDDLTRRPRDIERIGADGHLLHPVIRVQEDVGTRREAVDDRVRRVGDRDDAPDVPAGVAAPWLLMAGLAATAVSLFV